MVLRDIENITEISASDISNTEIAPTTLFTIGNSTSTPRTPCQPGQSPDDPFLQLSIALLTLACLLPHTRKHSALMSRAVLVGAWLVAVLWGGIILCSSDTLVWSATFVAINTIFAARSLCLLHSVHMGGQRLGELHRRVLRPLGVGSAQLQLLVQTGVRQRLSSGQHFAVEHRTALPHQLSVLLTGRMEVSSGETHLHFISPCQFINSLEWDLQNQDYSDTNLFKSGSKTANISGAYQVNIVAVEDCVYLSFDTGKLEAIMEHNSRLYSILRVAVGRDITQKVYNVAEQRPSMRSRLSASLKLVSEAASNQQPEKNSCFSSPLGRTRRQALLQLPLRHNTSSHEPLLSHDAVQPAPPSGDTANYITAKHIRPLKKSILSRQ